MIRWWKNLRNQLDYSLRQKMAWKFPIQATPTRAKFSGEVVPLSDRAQKIAKRLVADYHFEEYQQRTSLGNYQENLFYLHMLEVGCSQANYHLPEHLTVFDIGTSHWFYAPALSAFLTWFEASGQTRQMNVFGFESDPFRVYADFHSRYDHAIVHCQGLPGFQFVPHGFQPQTEKADLITFFFPFVFETDHLDWGLPLDHFRPNVLIAQAWNNIQPGGRMFIVNQGKEEHQRQKVILQEIGISTCVALKMDEALFQYDLDRYILVSDPHE